MYGYLSISDVPHGGADELPPAQADPQFRFNFRMSYAECAISAAEARVSSCRPTEAIWLPGGLAGRQAGWQAGWAQHSGSPQNGVPWATVRGGGQRRGLRRPGAAPATPTVEGGE
jgi:hypothetical protein